MNTPLHRFILFLLIAFASLTPLQVVLGQTSTTATVSDPEYDRYKKRGDDYFKEGKYPEARRQYQNCLEVPGFESDTYATNQINECNSRLVLRQKVDDAFRLYNSAEAVSLLKQLLALNPDDPITKAQLAAYYEQAANQPVNPNPFPELPPIQPVNHVFKPNKRVGVKVATGAVAIGAGVYAYVLRNDYQTKMATLNEISQRVDPSGSGVVDNPDTYQQYNEAYLAAQVAQQKHGLFKACLGVAALATLAEVYLFAYKPKLRTSGLHWKPSSQSVGLALVFTF
ncbi:hypothetical protein GCM10028805_22140 [Spirosoma harenae]